MANVEPKNWLGARIVAIVVAIAIYIRVARSLYTGEAITSGYRIVRRNEQPLEYWFYMAFYAAVPIFLVSYVFFGYGK